MGVKDYSFDTKDFVFFTKWEKTIYGRKNDNSRHRCFLEAVRCAFNVSEFYEKKSCFIKKVDSGILMIFKSKPHYKVVNELLITIQPLYVDF
jgi:hypothetical protein